MRCAGRRGVRSVIRGRENVIAVTRAVFDGMGWRHPLVIAVKRHAGEQFGWLVPDLGAPRRVEFPNGKSISLPARRLLGRYRPAPRAIGPVSNTAPKLLLCGAVLTVRSISPSGESVQTGVRATGGRP